MARATRLTPAEESALLAALDTEGLVIHPAPHAQERIPRRILNSLTRRGLITPAPLTGQDPELTGAGSVRALRLRNINTAARALGADPALRHGLTAAQARVLRAAAHRLYNMNGESHVLWDQAGGSTHRSTLRVLHQRGLITYRFNDPVLTPAGADVGRMLLVEAGRDYGTHLYRYLTSDEALAIVRGQRFPDGGPMTFTDRDTAQGYAGHEAAVRICLRPDPAWSLGVDEDGNRWWTIPAQALARHRGPIILG